MRESPSVGSIGHRRTQRRVAEIRARTLKADLTQIAGRGYSDIALETVLQRPGADPYRARDPASTRACRPGSPPPTSPVCWAVAHVRRSTPKDRSAQPVPAPAPIPPPTPDSVNQTPPSRP